MKLWKKLLALSMVLLMVFSFAACDGGVIEGEWDGENPSNKIHQSTDGAQQETEPAPTDPNEQIYGTWVKEIDISEPFTAGMESSLGGLVEIPQVPFYLVLSIEFRKDGTMTADFGLDEESFGAFADAFSENVRTYALETFAAMGLSGEDVELYCRDTFGISMDEYLTQLMEAMIDETAKKFPSIHMDMHYELEGTKLWIAENADALVEAADYMTLSVEDGMLLIKRLGGKEISQLQTAMEQFDEKLPWTLFKK